MNKKGFTLVELLGVIVILGIVLTIAIPAVSNYIDKSKREAFSDILHQYVDSVRKNLVSEEYVAPIDANDVLIVSLDLIPLDKGKKQSSFNSDWVKSKSYVAVINMGSGDNPDYEYFVAGQDMDNHAIPLYRINDVSRTEVISNAKNKMEVTIQSLCGTEDGKKATLATIKGLENFQSNDTNGRKMSWNATIYSSKDCATTR